MACVRSGTLARTAAALALTAALMQACTPMSSLTAYPASVPEWGLVHASGGVYRDRALSAYVNRVGLALVEAAGQSPGGWRFLVLDTPDSNAFSLPKGRIYVTRGMLALANDEAELATVLAHEIGHAVSGDAERALSERDRRVAELRADRLGMSYLEAAGYDARAQVDFLRTLLRNHRLAGERSATAAGGPDHPALVDRLAIASREAAGAPPGRREHAAYLAAIDGLAWGNGPAQGIVRGKTFFHPDLGFAIDAPPGYVLSNRADAVMAAGPRGAVFLLDSVPNPGSNPEDYLAHHWVPEIGKGIIAEPISGLRTTRLNGLLAAQGQLVLRGDHSERVADLTVIRLGDRLYRLTGLYQAGDKTGEQVMAKASMSFRKLGRAEAGAIEPLHLRVHRIVAGEDVAALAEAMPVKAPRRTFDLLNGLGPGTALRVGDEVKLVAR